MQPAMADPYVLWVAAVRQVACLLAPSRGVSTPAAWDAGELDEQLCLRRGLSALGWGWVFLVHAACLGTAASTAVAGDAGEMSCVMWACCGAASLRCQERRTCSSSCWKTCCVMQQEGCWQSFQQALSLADHDALKLHPACIVPDDFKLGATSVCNVLEGKHLCQRPISSRCQPARVWKMCSTQKHPQLRGPLETMPEKRWQLLARLWAEAQAPSGTGGATARGPPAKDGPALLETAPAALLSVSMMHQYWSGRPPPNK